MGKTLKETATRQRHVRLATQSNGLTAMQCYEICDEVFARAPRQTHGHAVNDRNQLVPILGAITGYDSDGKPVIARPLPEMPEPKRKPLRAVCIDSLVEADGNVDLAETHEVEELLSPAAANPLVAGVDDEVTDDEVTDDEEARFEQVADDAACESDSEDEIDEEIEELNPEGGEDGSAA